MNSYVESASSLTRGILAMLLVTIAVMSTGLYSHSASAQDTTATTAAAATADTLSAAVIWANGCVI